jgi:hypothetical protein
MHVSTLLYVGVRGQPRRHTNLVFCWFFFHAGLTCFVYAVMRAPVGKFARSKTGKQIPGHSNARAGSRDPSLSFVGDGFSQSDLAQH